MNELAHEIATSCVECERPAIAERGWRAFLRDIDDDGEDELLVYCPRCAAREFD
jgi:hypothetical protein